MTSQPSSWESQSVGPESLADLLARVSAVAKRRDEAEPAEQTSETTTKWFLHENESLRQGVYRVEAQGGHLHKDSIPEQLPLIKYEYPQLTVLSRLGELKALDLRVMAVVSAAFHALGCPEDNIIAGDEATLGHIARQLGMNPDGSAGDIRQSLERLATTKLVWRSATQVVDETGEEVSSQQTEVAHGFISGWAKRERKVKGKKVQKSNYIVLDQHMAALIRGQRFTWLRADVLRKLKNNARATTLYAFMRSHTPRADGSIDYGVMKLAGRIGTKDSNRSRLVRKIREAAEAVCAAAPDDFEGFQMRQGMHDVVLSMKRCPKVITGGASAPAAPASLTVAS